MDSKEKHKLTQRDQSTKDLFLSSGNTVRTSKSDEPVANAHPPKDKSNSIKSDKDVRFAAPPATTPQDTKDSNKSEKGSKEMLERQDSRLTMGSPKVPRKYFTNWRQACDKTKDRTKELLKRWRTLPETEGPVGDDESQIAAEDKDKSHGWSVHVWTTWVNRYSIDGGDGIGSCDEEPPEGLLNQLQCDKMTLFFTELLDTDRDDLVTEQDFEHFCEKLAHFADWSTNSPEFHILLEVKFEFIENFINPLPQEYKDKPYWRRITSGLPPGTVDCECWLARWSILLPACGRFNRLPLFLQYFCKILFGIINKSGSGKISKQEMKSFYMSIVGLSSKRCDEIMDPAFNSLTSNGQLTLDYELYKRCYCNWLCGKNPNGPGQWLLVPPKGPLSREPFPVDYSALNTDPDRLEKYTPDNKTNRHSVIV